jgi:hypothetical protein
MTDFWTRLAENLFDRLGGPMSFRFVLQPAVAAILAIIAGLQDARLGRSPYLRAILTEPAIRALLITDGWKRIGKVFIVAVVLDLIYQIVVMEVYPGEAIVVAVLLAIIPYVVMRGVVTRVAGILAEAGNE